MDYSEGLANTTRGVTAHEKMCGLYDIVAAMPQKACSKIFFRRDGAIVGMPYANCYSDACLVAEALHARGIRAGDRVAIHGATSYEWVLADLGCLLAGAISVALYPSAPQSRVIATAQDSRCRVVFTDTDDIAAELDAQGHEVIFLGRNGPNNLPSVDELLRPCNNQPQPAPLPPSRGNGPFTIVSTSGTLSEPKLFAVHSAPMLYTMDRFAELYGFGGEDRLLLYLPLSHLPQRMMLYWSLGAGMDLILSDPAHIVPDTAELAPTLHVAVPRSLEHMQWRVKQASRRNGGSSPAELEGAYRRTFGSSMKAIFVGSAPADRAVLTDLLAAGLPVYEVYGTTELGMIGLNTPAATRVGSVGRAIPWGDVRLDSRTSEILVRTPTPFLYGRLTGGEIVPVVWDKNAWIPTGDVGHIDDEGYLFIRGRLRDFIALRSGEKVFVKPIEDAAAAATGASFCVVTNTGAFLGALLFFEPTPTDATRHDRPSRESCRISLSDLNKSLHPWERIQSFAIVDRLPSIEEGAMTETMKLRRHKVDEIHAASADWHRVREN